MADPIRPNLTPHLPTAQPGGQARAAQRAFFDAALGKAQAPTASVAAPVQLQAQAPAVRPVPIMRETPDPDQPPDRILRPGSFVDIKV